MPGNKYVNSVKASDDIKAIAKYTIDKFGESQSLKYAQGFKNILNELGDNPELGRRYLAIKDKMVFRYRYMAHVIFYYKIQDQIFIVRVLGGKMDYKRHL